MPSIRAPATEEPRLTPTYSHGDSRYRRLFETAQDGILILDADSGRIIDVNPFMSSLLGFSPYEFLGKELWEVGLLEDAERNRAASKELRERGFIRYEDLPLKSKRKPQGIDVEFVSNRYVDNGRPVIQCNIRDITTRKRAELETRRRMEALAAADRQKDHLLAMVSHELRGALGPIMIALDILRQEAEAESARQQLARSVIERQMAHLCQHVDDLLDASRIAAGAMRFELERIDMRLPVERAVEWVRSSEARRGHSFVITKPDGPCWVNGNATRLEQVVVNLLINAAKYTADGGVISVALSDEEGRVELHVSDTGVGITADMLALVFEPFVQADTSVGRAEGGLGIGLTIVRRIVSLHGGTVTASSGGLGAGSEFIVSLPSLPSTSVQEHPNAA